MTKSNVDDGHHIPIEVCRGFMAAGWIRFGSFLDRSMAKEQNQTVTVLCVAFISDRNLKQRFSAVDIGVTSSNSDIAYSKHDAFVSPESVPH